jgi:hypothetical protein
MFTADQFTQIINPVAGPYSSHHATEEDREWLEEIFADSPIYENANHAILPHPTLEEINALGSPGAKDVVFSLIYSKEGQRVMWELTNYSCTRGIGTGKVITFGIGIHPDFRSQGHLPIFAKERFKAAKAAMKLYPFIHEWASLFEQYKSVNAPAVVSDQVTEWDNAPSFKVSLNRGQATYRMRFEDIYNSLEEE